jgi:hypothetical protein
MITSEFMSRGQAVSYYNALGQRFGLNSKAFQKEALELLPSFLCSQLLRGERPSASTSMAEIFTGNPDGEVRELREIGAQLCVYELRRNVLEGFDLATAYEVTYSEKRERLLHRCLAELTIDDPHGFQLIADFTSMISWLKRRKKTDTEVTFSSTSFHEFPYCTFLTDLSLFCIPPRIFFKSPSMYALQENLYHEALHQQLCTIIQFDAVLPHRTSLSRLPRIWIPWRAETWDLEHVLHAGYVYAHLLEMRLRARRGRSPQDLLPEVFDQAIVEGLKASQVLSTGLARHRSSLGPVGQEIVERLCEMVSDIESGLSK